MKGSNTGEMPKEVARVWRTNEEAMQVYDSLPASIRQLYDSAPYKCDVQQFYDTWKAYGWQAEGLIRQALEVEFPGWTQQQWDKVKGRVRR